MTKATARMSITAVTVRVGMAKTKSPGIVRVWLPLLYRHRIWIVLKAIVEYSVFMPFATIPEAIEETRAGRMLVVVDDEDRENEGDLTIAAEKITSEVINFMATFGRGLICLTLTGERCDALRLPLMSPHN